MGPTASGKTDLAIYLRRHLPLELISVDSSQVYKGLDIGTAKPDTETLKKAPHRLLDIRDPSQPYSAADFVNDAKREIKDIQQQGRLPLLVGGTMFYFNALEFGLSKLPEADPEIREQLEQEAAQLGWPALHERLEAIDPKTAGRINPNDAQRIQRALEIYETSGRPPSEIMLENPPKPMAQPVIKLALLPSDRSVLHAQIEQRFQQMLELGLLEEVKTLQKRTDLAPDLPAMRMVGYRQVWEYLLGGSSYSEMVLRAVAATRQLAKRQMTWIRRYPGVQDFDCQKKEAKREVLTFLQDKLGYTA